MDDRLTQLTCDAFNAKPEQIGADLALRDLDGWDSMAHMQFVVALEEEFGFELDGDEIADLETISDVRVMILRKTQDQR